MRTTGAINSIHELLHVAYEAQGDWDGEVWYRGQPDRRDPLRPGLYRAREGTSVPFHESRLGHEFKSRAGPRNPFVPDSEDLGSWLFLMQHYGLPTRLLDWSLSPLVALFFAVNKEPDRDGVLYVLWPSELNWLEVKRNAVISPWVAESRAQFRAAFGKTGLPYSSKTIAIRPVELDARMLVQMTYFTSHGARKALDGFKTAERFLRKFKIPTEKKEDLLIDLELLGIRLSNLFPDLDHLSKELRKEEHYEE